jgi:hypothetical protein
MHEHALGLDTGLVLLCQSVCSTLAYTLPSLSLLGACMEDA